MNDNEQEWKKELKAAVEHLDKVWKTRDEDLAKINNNFSLLGKSTKSNRGNIKGLGEQIQVKTAEIEDLKATIKTRVGCSCCYPCLIRTQKQPLDR